LKIISKEQGRQTVGFAHFVGNISKAADRASVCYFVFVFVMQKKGDTTSMAAKPKMLVKMTAPMMCSMSCSFWWLVVGG